MDDTEELNTGQEKDSDSQDSALTLEESLVGVKMRPFDQLGDFRIEGELGRGGMGVVYRATELQLGREVALKILPLSQGRVSRTQIERFQLEARAAAKLNHDHIVPVYHNGEDQGTRYFAMKLVSGDNLASLVKSARKTLRSMKTSALKESVAGSSAESTDVDSTKNEFSLSADTIASAAAGSGSKYALQVTKSVAAIGMRVADALNHAHVRGVIHRDIKPSNLILDLEGKIWVTDFGLAQLQNSPSLTNTGDIVGTLRYMSPEQASGRRSFVDNRTDIYSLGVTLYELSTLRTACRGRTTREILREITFENLTPLRKVNPRIPRDFETIIAKATQRNPDDRYQTAREFADDLERFVNNEPVRARPPSWIVRFRNSVYERPKQAALIAAAGVFSLLGMFLGLVNLRASLQDSQNTVAAVAKALTTSNSDRLLAHANLVKESDPALALELAKLADTGEGDDASDSTYLSILDDLYEFANVIVAQPGHGEIVSSTQQTSSSLILKCVDGQFYGQGIAAEVISISEETKPSLQKLSSSETITTGAFDPAGRYLLTAGSSYYDVGLSPQFSNIQLTKPVFWNASGSSRENRLGLDDCYAISLKGRCFSASGRKLVLPKKGNRATIFQVDPWEEVGPTLEADSPIVHAVFSNDGRSIATFAESGEVILFDAADGTPKARNTFTSQRPLGVRVSFSPNDELVMLSGSGIALYEIADLSVNAKLSGDIALFSETGEKLFYSQRHGDAVFEYSLNAGEETREFKLSRPVFDLALADDSETLAVACKNEIRLFATQDGSLKGICKGHAGFVQDLANLPGNRLASAGWDGRVRFWNTRSDEERRRYLCNFAGNSLKRIAYSENGERGLISSISVLNSSVRGTGNPGVETSVVDGICRLIRDDGVLVTFATNRLVAWSSNRTLIAEKLIEEQQAPANIFDLEDDKFLVHTISGDLLVWDLPTNIIEKINGFNEVSQFIHPTANPFEFWVGRLDGSIQLLRGTEFDAAIEVSDSAIYTIDLSADQKRLLLTTSVGEVLHFDLGTKTILSSFSGTKEQPIIQAFFAKNDDYAVAHGGMRYGDVGLWNLEKESLEATVKLDRVAEVVVADDGNQVAIAAYMQGAILWDLEDLAERSLTKGVAGKVWFSGEKILIATRTNVQRGLVRSEEGEIPKLKRPSLIVWDTELNEVAEELELDRSVADVCFSPSGEIFVLAGEAYCADLLRVYDGKQIARLGQSSTELIYAGFAPRDRLVTVSRSGSVSVHDPEAAVKDEVYRGEYLVVDAAQSPDGKYVVLSNLNGETREINLDEMTTRELPIESSIQSTFVYSSDSGKLIACDGSSLVEFWDVTEQSKETHDVAEPVFKAVALELDGVPYALLLAGERKARMPAVPVLDSAFEKSEDKADAWLIDLERLQKRPIYLDGDVVDAKVASKEGQAIFLTNARKLEFVSLNSLENVGNFDLDRNYFRIMSIANGKVFVGRSERILGIDILDQTVSWEHPAELGSDLGWEISPTETEWFLVPTPRSVQRIPAYPSKQAAEYGGREFSDAEKRKFLIELTAQPRGI